MGESFLRRWPLMRQLLDGGDGTGPEAMSAGTRAQQDRTRESGVEISRSVCPYCAVGCGQLIYAKDNQLLAIEGDPQSPISGGALCPKGSASHQLLTHAGRETRVKYRAPHASQWQEIPLEKAMDLLAERVWESRKAAFQVADADGHRLNHTTRIAHLGGATLDNEENYLIKKLFTGGLGMVAVSNQARI